MTAYTATRVVDAEALWVAADHNDHRTAANLTVESINDCLADVMLQLREAAVDPGGVIPTISVTVRWEPTS